MPPDEPRQLVVFVFLLEAAEVCQRVVGDPQPVGETVGQDHVHCVVPTGQQEEHHTRHTGEQGQPVDGVVSLGGVCREEKLVRGQGDDSSDLHCLIQR